MHLQKGRKISEAIRFIQDMFHCLNTEQKDGLIISVDFQKAFDPLDHDYIYCALEAIGFDPLYYDIEGCMCSK